ncbi:MAG: Crp/Fnr family transcriptional regulator [Bacteroidota bacterium]
MKELEILSFVLHQFADLSADDFNLSAPFWHHKAYKKGQYYNQRNTVCKHLGFIHDGVFRSYVIDEKTNEEKNVFLYSKNQFVAPFKSFINQIPCDYHTEALTDASIHYISITDLHALYKQSHNWERVGRLMAQEAFNVAMGKIEAFVFKTPEERYLDLVEQQPDIFNSIPLYHISSYLGIKGPSLSRIRKRISGK